MYNPTEIMIREDTRLQILAGHADSSRSQVTNDPEAFKHPIIEGTGVITSDSLAAESVRDGGDFANGKAGISGQKSEGSTASNTDTSGATRLDAAPDAEARMAAEEWSETSQLNASSKVEGGGPTYKTPADDAGFEEESSSAGIAPYAVTHHDDPTIMKPKGKNLEEGGFDENAPNASFKYDIGSKNDPGLAAEQKYTKQNAHNASDVGRATDAEVSGDGQYDALKDEEA